MLYLWSLQEGGQTKQFRVLWQVSSVLWQLHISISRENFMIFTKNTIYVNALDSFSIRIKVIFTLVCLSQSWWLISICKQIKHLWHTPVAESLAVGLSRLWFESNLIYVFFCLVFMYMMPNFLSDFLASSENILIEFQVMWSKVKVLL